MNLFHKIAWNVCEQLQHTNLPLYKILRTIFDLLSLYFQKKSWKEQAIVYKS